MQPGTRLGHYEILARLGAGGMGEVYRALDTKLGRAIALKVLPAHLSTDEAQLARLQREARALASLNHPRIATIHALEQDGEVCFLALELIDGETLAESVRAGPLPVDRALHIATQIADGLEGAHEAGIIHRDLKPANVMVTARGDVKILDFGLAKPWHPAGESPGTAAATLPESITEQGRFVGTVPYMSPEHVRGETLDRRTDIWAFGCVLFELLCAQRAFPGATPAESIAAVLKEEPDWEALPPELPAEMERTLRRCLDKDLDRRLRDIADARIEIADCIPGSARGSAASSGGTRGRPQRRPQPAARLRPSAVALAVAAVAVIAGITYMVGPRFDAPPDAPSSEIATTLRRVSILLPEQAPLDIHTSAYRVMALSPDGSQLVYRTPEARLYLRALDRFDSTPIPGTDGADYPFISPDGEWVGFITAGRLKKVRLAGGDPVTVTDVPVGQGATWTPDGGIVFTGSHGLWIVPADGGPARVLTNADVDGADEAHDTPAWLPGGKVVFRRRTALDGGRLAVVSVDGGQVEVLEERGNRPRYLASGHLMFSRPSIAEGETLYVRPFDPSTSRFTGPAVRVLECLRPFVGRVDAPVAISANGVLAYLAGARTLPTLVWVDEAGVETELTPEPRDFKTVSLSPDGTRIASTVQADGQNVADIWMVDAERGTAARFTSEAGFTDGSLWSPDGEWLLHYQLRPRQPGSSIVRRRVNAEALAETLLATSAPGQFLYPISMTPDGKDLLVTIQHPSGDFDVGVVRLDEERELQPLLSGPSGDSAWLSPDGHLLAIQSTRSGGMEIYIQPYPGPGRTVRVSADGGVQPLWSVTGDRLFFLNNAQEDEGVATHVMAVDVSNDDEVQISEPQLLFSGEYQLGLGFSYDVDATGRRFVMIKPPPAANRELRVVLDWFEEVKALSPPG